MPSVRTPAVAGLFYPADARQLAHDVQALLDAASPHDLTPKALIAPHAGYIYSGPVAASAYATLAPAPPTASRSRCAAWLINGAVALLDSAFHHFHDEFKQALKQ